LGLDNIKNKSFLDIGCGSGIFSYAAFNLGAKEIYSFDIDNLSIKCCNYFYNKAGNPKNWKILKGSIIDNIFLSRLKKYDVVYSWGVLHHTGEMWKAIENSASLVDRNGYYLIAIYNKVQGRMGSTFWLKIKKIYNNSPVAGKFILEIIYIAAYFLLNLLKFKNPSRLIRDYKSNRGMNWRRDITDWLGGYPYEFATVEEIFKFVKTKFPNFNLVNINTTNGLGNNSYLFKNQL